MKKRVIFCLFISIYLIYTHKDNLKIKIEDFPYINSAVRLWSELNWDNLNNLNNMNIYLNSLNKETLREEGDVNLDTINNIPKKRNDNKNKNDNISSSISMSILEEEFNSHLRKAKYSSYSDITLPYAKKMLNSGYDFEEHKIQTEDGYILTAWRIPGKIDESPVEKRSRRPVILQHGLFDSSYTWLVLNITESLPIQLSNEGFDVWMTNSRGNVFSLEHINAEYDANLFYSKFWDFTFHEMAQYDLPANIFYIKNLTNWEKVNYIGHSQGTVQYFIQYTLNPTFIEENVDKFVAIGTVVNVFNTTSKIVHILDYTYGMILAEKLNVKNILTMSNYMYDLIGFACKNMNFLCRPIVQFFVEDHPTNRIDYSKLFNEFYHMPGGTSARNVNHWIQFYTTKRFEQFDYGREMNYVKYGQHRPPVYDLTKFTHYSVKSMMTISNSDPFSKWEDCQHLFQFLKPDVYKILRLDNYNHLDYLWSDDASEDLFPQILRFINDDLDLDK